MTEKLAFRLLGPLEVVVDGRPVELIGAKRRSLLAILLLHANEAVSVDRLADLLWEEEPPPAPANALQALVSQLRRLLEPSPEGGRHRLLVFRAPGYVLNAAPEQIDIRIFEELVSEARRELPASPELASSLLRRGLELWRGPALADFSFASFARDETARLEELRIAALEDRLEAELAIGRHAEVIGELEALVAQNPLREALVAHLMTALYRSGRQAEALAVLRNARRELDEQLGIDPGAVLRALERDILLHDPSLEAPESGAPDGAPRPAPTNSGEQPHPGPSVEQLAVRKTITAMCCEVAAISEGEIDAEALERVNASLFTEIGTIVSRHGGTVGPQVGDQITVVFGVPELHENDALRALASSVEIREHLPELAAAFGDWDLQIDVSIGVNTGEAVTLESGLPVGGAAVNAAVRLVRSARPGDIVLDARTHLALRGGIEVEEIQERRGGPRPASSPRRYRLVRLLPGAGNMRRLDAPMVGRAEERAQLVSAYWRTIRDRRSFLFTVLGAAGVGKSRLLAELVSDLDEVPVYHGRCLPYGEGITFLPIAEMVRAAADIAPDASVAEAVERIAALLKPLPDGALIAERVAQACGLGEGLSPLEETLWAVRKFFEALARRGPIVAVFDDIHWAEQTLLDLIDHIADHSLGAPILLVCLARPEFLDQRPAWGGGKLNASSLLLPPLDPNDSRQLIRNLLAGPEVAVEIEARVIDAAEGNPLYVEEMIRMLVDDGHLRLEGSRWVAEAGLTDVPAPPTIQALLAARLDRLGVEERQVLERAAVIGRSFDSASLSALCEEPLRGRVPAHLLGLTKKELLYPDLDESAEKESYRWRHMLMRDAAYREIPKERRAVLHERYAASLEREGDRRPSDEMVGYHLERAFLCKRELGALGPGDEGLARRASALLAVSARRASARGDLPAASNLLERSAALLDKHSVARMDLLLDLCTYLTDIGELRRAEQVLDDVKLGARAVGDRRLEARAAIEMWELRSLNENQKGWKEEAIREARSAVAIFEEHGDELGLARALRLEASTHQNDYRFEAADQTLERALVHARRANSDEEEAKIYDVYTRGALWGPAHVDVAMGRYQEWLDRFEGNLLVEASCRRGMAALAAMQGHFDEARRSLQRSKDILRDMGASLMASTSFVPGIVELLAGDPGAAEREFRSSYEMLERAGERNARATAAAYLARSLYEIHSYSEAERFTVISEDLAPEDDFAAKVEWSTTRAKLVARRGDLDTAMGIAAEAVRMASETDDLETLGNVIMDEAEVIRIGGRHDELGPRIRKAVELYETKGDVVSAGRARGLLQGVADPS